jgi:hypothetical protein
MGMVFALCLLAQRVDYSVLVPDDWTPRVTPSHDAARAERAEAAAAAALARSEAAEAETRRLREVESYYKGRRVVRTSGLRQDIAPEDAGRSVGPPPDDAEADRRRAEWSALRKRTEEAEADALAQRRRAEQAEAGLDALVRSDAYEARGQRAAGPQRTSPVLVPPAPQVVQPAPVVPTYTRPVTPQQPVAYAQPATVPYQAPAAVQYQAPAGETNCPYCGQSHGFGPFRRFGGGFRSIPAAPP